MFWLFLALAIGFALPPAWCAEDQEKAEKLLRRLTALAVDPAARPLVSQAVAEFLKVPRAELVRQRRATNLSYGTVFLARRLAAPSMTMESISAQLHQGRTIWQIGDARHADWRQITSDAKKLNDRIEDSFYDFFRKGHLDRTPWATEEYDAAKDSVAADQQGVTEQDIAAARDTYVRCFRRARNQGGTPAALPDDRSHTPPGIESDPR